MRVKVQRGSIQLKSCWKKVNVGRDIQLNSCWMRVNVGGGDSYFTSSCMMVHVFY
jgi:hypothetical protein